MKLKDDEEYATATMETKDGGKLEYKDRGDERLYHGGAARAAMFVSVN